MLYTLLKYNTVFSPRYIGARYCQGKLSVRTHVRLSVTLRHRDHIGWNSWKMISRLISLTFFTLYRPQQDRSAPKGTPPNFSRNKSVVGKIVDFRHSSRRISETPKRCKIGSKLLLTTNRNMCTRFPTIDDFE